jgi:hypothetical protein
VVRALYVGQNNMTCSYTEPGLGDPIAIFCAIIVFASSIYCLYTARKNPANLSHVISIQYFVIILVTSIGSAFHFLGRYSILLAEGNTDENRYYEVINEVALVNADVAKNGLWFALIVIVGSFSGALALIMKKAQQDAPSNGG